MKIQLLSDLHCEFHKDGGSDFVDSLNPNDIDVLVLAGDIAVGKAITDALCLFCQHYEKAQVLYVHGNHEFYGTSREVVLEATKLAVACNPNLKWLDCEAVTIGERRFLGAPLWFAHEPKAARYEEHMNDFNTIVDFRQWVYEENKRAVEFFKEELREGDIAISHHLPSERSVSRWYKGDPLNPFFLCDMTKLILERVPALWFHGHTHDSCDYVMPRDSWGVEVGGTRVVCNPFGYVGAGLNREFKAAAVFTV